MGSIACVTRLQRDIRTLPIEFPLRRNIQLALALFLLRLLFPLTLPQKKWGAGFDKDKEAPR